MIMRDQRQGTRDQRLENPVFRIARPESAGPAKDQRCGSSSIRQSSSSARKHALPERGDRHKHEHKHKHKHGEVSR